MPNTPTCAGNGLIPAKRLLPCRRAAIPGTSSPTSRVAPARKASSGNSSADRKLPWESDTTYLCVVDGQGNAFSATPSDGVGGAAVVPGLGFPISHRGTQSWLDPDHASSLMPGKRPRLTPNPALALRDGRPYMPFGCPGGDAQVQGMLQVFLNVVEFGMDPQSAIEAPRVITHSFPNSFWPHITREGVVTVETRIAEEAQIRPCGPRDTYWKKMVNGAGGSAAYVPLPWIPIRAFSPEAQIREPRPMRPDGK